jgi:hypothetical protein
VGATLRLRTKPGIRRESKGLGRFKKGRGPRRAEAWDKAAADPLG